MRVIVRLFTCRAILTSGNSIIFTKFFLKPVIMIPTGFDLNVLPFMKDNTWNRIRSAFFRLGVHRISSIFVTQKNIIQAAQRLGIGSKVSTIPTSVNIAKIRGLKSNFLISKLENNLSKFKMVILLPTRKAMEKSSLQYKGSDKILAAISMLVSKIPSKTIKIMSINNGHSFREFNDMAKNYGLNSLFVTSDELTQRLLHNIMHLRNIAVLDQFAKPDSCALGGTEREALVIGAPIISATLTNTEEFLKAYGPDCPLINAFSPKQIFESLLSLYNASSKELEKRSHLSRRWADKNLDMDIGSARYSKEIIKVINT